MNEDRALTQALLALSPTEQAERRMERAILRSLDEARPSLFRAARELFAGRPFAHGALAVAAGALFVLGTPVGALLLAVLRLGLEAPS